MYTTILPIVALTLSSFLSGTAANKFSQSCPYSTFEGSGLTSVCWGPDGVERTTTLDLNQCVGNVNGMLVWTPDRAGSFSDSCYGCVLAVNEPTGALELSCQCIDKHWESSVSMINLDDNVENHDGDQECFGIRGALNETVTEGAQE